MANQSLEFKRPELIAVDAHFRDKWLAAITIFILLPTCALWYFPSTQDSMLRLFSDKNSSHIFRLLIVFYSYFSILAILLFTAGLQLFLSAKKALKYGYFPAPYTWVLYDTWRVSGLRAKYLPI